jgi:integrase
MPLRFTHLTRPNIRALAIGERITEAGITAERMSDGDVRYSVNVMVDGERVHRVVGRESDGVTRTKAEELVQKIRTEAREERLSLPKGRKTRVTFEKAADDYLKKLEETDGKNIKVKRRQLVHQLKPFFNTQRLNTITTFTIERYKKRRKEAGAAVGTINRELTTLSHLFSKAVEWNWITTKPCKIPKDKEEEGRIVVLSDDEADALLRAAIADQDPYLWLFVMFGLNTAMRHAEILGARFDHLDLKNLRLHMIAMDLKSIWEMSA